MNTNRISRRGFLQVGAMSLGAMALARCAPGPSPTAAGKVPIMVYSWQNLENYIAHYQYLKETFEAQHPEADVTYRYFNGDEFSSALSASIAANEQPDFAQSDAGVPSADLIKDGLLMDLAPHIDADPEWKRLTDLAETSMDYRYYDGRVFLLCNSLSPMFMLWHKDILDANGLSLPETIDDLIAMVPVLAESGISVVGTGFGSTFEYSVTFMAMERSLDPDNSWWHRVERGEESPNHPTVRSILEAWEAIAGSGVFYPGYQTISYSPGSDDLYAQRKVAAQWSCGIWSLTRIPEAERAPDACKVDISTWPKIEESNPTGWIGGMELMHGVKASPANPELVLAFAKHMNSLDAQRNLLENRIIPVSSEVMPQSSTGDCFFDRVLRVQSETPLFNHYYPYNPSLAEGIETAMAELALGTTSVDGALQTIETAWTTAFGEG